MKPEEERLEGSLSSLRLVVTHKALAYALNAVQEGVSWWGNKHRTEPYALELRLEV